MFATWQYGKTMLASESQMFGKQCILVWPGQQFSNLQYPRCPLFTLCVWSNRAETLQNDAIAHSVLSTCLTTYAFEWINQEFKGLRKKISSAALFRDRLQGAKGAQRNYFSCSFCTVVWSTTKEIKFSKKATNMSPNTYSTDQLYLRFK